MKLFLVGQYKSGEFGSVCWDFQGVFDSYEKAEKACLNSTFFVGPVNLNEQIAEETIKWDGCHYPKSGVRIDD